MVSGNGTELQPKDKEEEEKKEEGGEEEKEEEEERVGDGDRGSMPLSCEQRLYDTLKSCGLLQSVRHVLEDIGDVRAVESVVTHLPLGYVGTCDCIAKYK